MLQQFYGTTFLTNLEGHILGKFKAFIANWNGEDCKFYAMYAGNCSVDLSAAKFVLCFLICLFYCLY